MLEDAIDRAFEEINFTVGNEPFKYRFANLERQNVTFMVFRTRAMYWAYRGFSGITGMLRVLRLFLSRVRSD